MPELADPDSQSPWRVATFGLADELQFLLRVVLRHLQRNRYRFVLCTTRGPGDFDIALVDMTSAAGALTAQALAEEFDERALLRVGRRSDPARPCDDLLVSDFIGQILQALNRVVDARRMHEFLRRRQAALDAGWLVAEGDRLRRPRALIVDDSPTVRAQLALALARTGLEAEAAANAPEALDAFSSRSYELLFVDVVMPGVDGYVLTRSLRRMAGGRDVPILLLTGRSSPIDRARGILAGCSAWLVKPVSMHALGAIVQRQLRRSVRRRHREGRSDGPATMPDQPWLAHPLPETLPHWRNPVRP